MDASNRWRLDVPCTPETDWTIGVCKAFPAAADFPRSLHPVRHLCFLFDGRMRFIMTGDGTLPQKPLESSTKRRKGSSTQDADVNTDLERNVNQVA